MAQQNNYDMILLDIMLPKMDGFEVCQHIREFSNMPIVMLCHFQQIGRAHV